MITQKENVLENNTWEDKPHRPNNVLVHAKLMNTKEEMEPPAISSKMATKFVQFNVNYLVPKTNVYWKKNGYCPMIFDQSSR